MTQEQIVELFLGNLQQTLFGSSSKLSLYYLAGASLIAAVYYKARMTSGVRGFFVHAFGRDIWLNKSAFVDVLFSLLLIAGVWSGAAFGFDWQTKLETFILIDLGISHRGLWPEGSHLLAIQVVWTLLAVVVRDLGSYWAHYCLHNVPTLWAFHAVHHSPKKLNFFSLWRIHPIEAAVFTACEALSLMFLGWISSLVFGTAWVPRIVAFYVTLRAALAFFAQFRHSMVWLPFPKALSHVFVSPAMHQVHHSMHPDHSGKNLAVNLSLWDWLFGTLHVPTQEDRFKIAMGVSEEERLDATSMMNLLLVPFANSLRRAKPQTDGVSKSVPESVSASTVLSIDASSRAEASSGNVERNDVPRTRSS